MHASDSGIHVRPAATGDVPAIALISNTSVSGAEEVGFGVPRSESTFADPGRLQAAWREPNFVGTEEVCVPEIAGRMAGVVATEDRGDRMESVNIDVPRDLKGAGLEPASSGLWRTEPGGRESARSPSGRAGSGLGSRRSACGRSCPERGRSRTRATGEGTGRHAWWVEVLDGTAYRRMSDARPRMRTSRAARAYDLGYIASYRAGARLVDPTRPTTVLVRFVDRQGHGGRALELGCGEGRDAIFLARRGYRVVAFDTSSAVLGRARRRAREEGVRVRFSVGDMAGRLPFPDASFDLVAAIDSFHMVTAPPNRARHFREVHRVLKPGGFYFFCNHVAKRPRLSSGGGMEAIDVRTPRGTESVSVPRVPYAVLTKAGYVRAIKASGLAVRTARAAWMFPIYEPAVLIVGEKTVRPPVGPEGPRARSNVGRHRARRPS